MERFTDSQTYYVVFDQALGIRKWWHILLHPKFRHVFLMRDNSEGSLVINSMAHVIAIKQYPNSITNLVQQELAQFPTAILQYTVHYGSHYKENYIELLTCVSVVKRILGIRSHLITPKSLYHELLKAGAIAIKPYVV